MAERIELFANNGEAPIAPSVGLEVEDPTTPGVGPVNIHSVSNGVSLISRGVEDAIKGEVVKSILIPETVDIIVPNYMLDFRKFEKLGKHQICALTCILDDEGDTAIYVYLKNGIQKLGMGIGASLDRVLPAGVQSIFGEKCILYRDIERDKPLREIKQQDVSKIRLRL